MTNDIEDMWLVIPQENGVYKTRINTIKQIIETDNYIFIYYVPDNINRQTEFSKNDWNKRKLMTTSEVFNL